jgi:hypothetical protein
MKCYEEYPVTILNNMLDGRTKGKRKCKNSLEGIKIQAPGNRQEKKNRNQTAHFEFYYTRRTNGENVLNKPILLNQDPSILRR